MSAAFLISALATFAQLAISMATFLLHRGAGKNPPGGGDPDRLAQTLARTVREACTRSLDLRGLRLPLPMRHRWRVLPTSSGAPSVFPPHLIGMEDPHWPVAGLVDALWRLPDQRLLVRGEPGAAKTTLALLLTQAARVREPGRGVARRMPRPASSMWYRCCFASHRGRPERSRCVTSRCAGYP